MITQDWSVELEARLQRLRRVERARRLARGDKRAVTARQVRETALRLYLDAAEQAYGLGPLSPSDY
jgi:hypothetical protein